MIVQIYGAKTIEDAAALAALGVDYIGLDVADNPDDRALMKQIVDLVRDRLTNGLVWSIPVTLAVTSDVAAGIREGQEVALCEGERPLAVMTVTEKYGYDKQAEAGQVYRTTLCILMLEVFYRFLPTGGLRG